MQDCKAILETDTFYHIYNRANGIEKLFANEENYLFFLKKYHFYISPIADTFAYCLMPNHFHFLVRMKNIPNSTFQKFEKVPNSDKTYDVFKTSYVYSEAFRRLFMSYTKAYNKQQIRNGSLFTPHFNRKKITTPEYLKNTINYIHLNPVLHNYVNEIDEWKFSSYTAFLSEKQSSISKTEVFELFDNKDNFVFFHNERKAEKYSLEMELAY
jgi:REP element-mobilizing transposase RayT